MASSRDLPPRAPEPHLLRFHLRQLLLVVALVSVFCTLIVITEGPWPMIVIVSTLVLSGHVLGNLIGTRLRDTSDEVQRWLEPEPRQSPGRPLATPPPYSRTALPEKTNLAQFRAEIWGMQYFLLTGLLLGALTGGSIIRSTIGDRITGVGWAVGTISSAVLGLWLAFLAVSFCTIAREALQQAQGKEVRQPTREV